jgi:ferritin-like protein
VTEVSDYTAGQAALRQVRKETIERLAKKGIDEDLLAQKLLEELSATHQSVFYDSKRGQIQYSDQLITWKIRQNARMDAQKLLDLYPAEKHSLTVDATQEMVELFHAIDGKTRATLPCEEDEDGE